jgi:hypothetical protein
MVLVPKSRNEAVTSRFPTSLDSAAKIGRVKAPPKMDTTMFELMIEVKLVCETSQSEEASLSNREIHFRKYLVKTRVC